MNISLTKGIRALSILSGVVCLLVISVVLLFPSNHQTPVWAASAYLFHPGLGSATLDGYIQPGEWAGADSLTLTMAGSSYPDPVGTLYVMQSPTDLYLGFAVDAQELTQDDLYGIYGDTVFFEFDDNNSGSLFEVYENKALVYATSPWYGDHYFFVDTGGSYADITQTGGETNGAGASGHHDDHNHYEMRFPLCSADFYDFCLTPGDILGLRVGYYDIYQGEPDLNMWLSFYPANTKDSLVTIEVIDVNNCFLPLVLK